MVSTNQDHEFIGEPPKWTPLAYPAPLPQDSGEYFRDENSARFPDFPLQPMLEAVITEKPDFEVRDIDIIACGSTLGNLLRFVQGQDTPFRMLVEVVDNTVCFMRRENSPRELISGVYGYGHTFPEAYTSWSREVKGSESHQRVIKYDLAGFKCLVRYEVDGYLPEALGKEDDKPKSDQRPSEDVTELEELLSSDMQKAMVSNMPESAEDAASRPLKTEIRGKRIPQSALFDLKTRSIKKKHEEDTLESQIPRLWLRQIPNFILGYHSYGLFHDISIHHVSAAIEKWEEDQQATLTKFAVLLNKITAFARSMESGKLEITREEDSSVLSLREQCDDAGRAFPPHITKLWDAEAPEPGSDEYAWDSNGSDSDRDGSDVSGVALR